MAILRIIFTVLSALCLAALLPAGTFGGLPYFFACAGGAGVFFLFVLLLKHIEKKKEPSESTPDFLNRENSSDSVKEDDKK